MAMTEGFDPPVKEDNRDPRVACALLLDTSDSMNYDNGGDGARPIDQLNKGYEALRESLVEDPLARKRTEIAVITFGGTAQIAMPFTEGRDLKPMSFHASGGTPDGSRARSGARSAFGS